MSQAPSPTPSAIPTTLDLAPLLDTCIHCGLCLEHCPTYAHTGLETMSPRGRLVLMKSIERQEFFIDDAKEALDTCLGCLGCQSACPAGVPYDTLLLATRLKHTPPKGPLAWGLKGLRWLLTRHGWLHLSARLAVDGRALARPVLPLLPTPLARAMALPPAATQRFERPPTTPLKADTHLLFTGCVMEAWFGRVHQAALGLLARQGLATQPAPAGLCCSALHLHQGDAANSVPLIQKTLQHLGPLLEGHPERLLLVNAAGCGHFLKHYGQLPDLVPHPWSDQERHWMALIGAQTRDVLEVLTPDTLAQARQTDPVTVYYAPPCHLEHGQRITHQRIEALLGALPGVTVATRQDTAPNGFCCGGAGAFTLMHADLSRQLAHQHRAQWPQVDGPLTILNANPGCLMQLEASLREQPHPHLTLQHPLSFIAQRLTGAPQ